MRCPTRAGSTFNLTPLLVPLLFSAIRRPPRVERAIHIYALIGV